MSRPNLTLKLRDVRTSDLDTFFDHMQDEVAVRMAAFTPPDPSDRIAFDHHWNRLLTDASVKARTIIAENSVVGHIASFSIAGEREITYWISREVWGGGIATHALRTFLKIEPTRPLFGRAAFDNLGSIRVLQKCGFNIVGTDTGYANGRAEEIDELVLRLD